MSSHLSCSHATLSLSRTQSRAVQNTDVQRSRQAPSQPGCQYLRQSLEATASCPSTHSLLGSQVTELFAALMGGGSEPALASVQASGVLRRALTLVLRYPFNNLLHLQARAPDC